MHSEDQMELTLLQEKASTARSFCEAAKEIKDECPSEEDMVAREKFQGSIYGSGGWKLFEVQCELIDTEQSYNTNLGNFIEHLKTISKQEDKSILSYAIQLLEASKIQSDELIKAYDDYFLNLLKEPREKANIDEKYNNIIEIHKLVAQNITQLSKFYSLFGKTPINHDGKSTVLGEVYVPSTKLTVLASFLEPVQRLPRYGLLHKELDTRYADTSYEERSFLAEVKTLSSNTNEAVRESESKVSASSQIQFSLEDPVPADILKNLGESKLLTYQLAEHNNLIVSFKQKTPVTLAEIEFYQEIVHQKLTDLNAHVQTSTINTKLDINHFRIEIPVDSIRNDRTALISQLNEISPMFEASEKDGFLRVKFKSKVPVSQEDFAIAYRKVRDVFLANDYELDNNSFKVGKIFKKDKLTATDNEKVLRDYLKKLNGEIPKLISIIKKEIEAIEADTVNPLSKGYGLLIDRIEAMPENITKLTPIQVVLTNLKEKLENAKSSEKSIVSPPPYTIQSPTQEANATEPDGLTGFYEAGSYPEDPDSENESESDEESGYGSVTEGDEKLFLILDKIQEIFDLPMFKINTETTAMSVVKQRSYQYTQTSTLPSIEELKDFIESLQDLQESSSDVAIDITKLLIAILAKPQRGNTIKHNFFTEGDATKFVAGRPGLEVFTPEVLEQLGFKDGTAMIEIIKDLNESSFDTGVELEKLQSYQSDLQQYFRTLG